ncbi:restriction endonuclease [uncultured Victivallis sp.]|uniref:restriction endonuclease n=1 Tax=uncultured Victivallis sp. TaxID=354118 RepID=UPI0025E5D086|nr:restriction endonuclease [uncultured Victivallis sp.]
MALWMVRAGRRGEYAEKFIKDHCFYITWSDLNCDLAGFHSRDEIKEKLREIYPDVKTNTIRIWASQIWMGSHEISAGDWVILPLKSQPSIWIGEVVQGYQFDPAAASPYFHRISVKWIGENIPRSNFAQDLLFSFGSALTICRISRNNAEERLRNMEKNRWTAGSDGYVTVDLPSDETEETFQDVEELARDQIIRLIGSRFKGHELARLVNGILAAQGYHTFMSPPGPDGGVDILAGTGPLGFGEPRLCVQVKSQDTPVELKEIKALKGAMQDSQATQGLFVSWGGYKSSVKEQSSFFSVRLWGKNELLAALFQTYEKLDPELRADLPLKQIWTLTDEE